MSEVKKYLNRDGLEEYNSLLPHSSGEMQEYVNDWLDAHPEATTTVQDGAITEPKLADKSVSLRTLADDTVHILKGMMITREISGDILTADDAYSAPPVALTVDGKSTQDGTPTPDAPVEIVSVEQLLLAFASKNLLDESAWVNNSYIGANGNTGAESGQYYTQNYSPVIEGNYTLQMKRPASGNGGRVRLHGYDADKNWVAQLWTDVVSAGIGSYSLPISIPTNVKYLRISASMQVTNFQLEIGSTASAYTVCTKPLESVLLPLTAPLRSLPDGTKDTLALSYLRPSTREGWAWYTPTLTVNVGRAVLDGSETWGIGSGTTDRMYTARNDMLRATNYQQRILCTALRVYPYYESVGAGVTGISGWSGGRYPGQNWFYVGINEITTAAAMKQHFADNPTEVLYELATPTTETLDPIELPVLPAPNCTVWADPSTGLRMQYIRDGNLVIQRIEEAIADQ